MSNIESTADQPENDRIRELQRELARMRIDSINKDIAHSDAMMKISNQMTLSRHQFDEIIRNAKENYNKHLLNNSDDIIFGSDVNFEEYSDAGRNGQEIRRTSTSVAGKNGNGRVRSKNTVYDKALSRLIKLRSFVEKINTKSDSEPVLSGESVKLNGKIEGGYLGVEFAARSYLEDNPDVVASGMDPLLHFVRHGAREGRPFRVPFEADLLSWVSSLPDFNTSGLRPNGRKFSLLYVSGEANTPGNIYRVRRFIDAARLNGVAASWIDAANLTEDLSSIEEFDALIIWRTPWSNAVSSLVDFAKEKGRKIIFDCDDLMIRPDLAEIKIIDGIRSQFLTEESTRSHFERIRQTMMAADLCFTTTQELAFHMRWAGKTTHVMPNGFDQPTHDLSRLSARQWRVEKDGLVRLGYAGGSRSHQRDFGLLAEAVARILQTHVDCRLVLFRTADGTALIDVEEYPALEGVVDQIEWRPLQSLQNLPREMARFDINLAPLEFGNPFCEAKSELKFFEAALVDVPTVASPTGPFRRAIDHGVTGFLAASSDDWHAYLDLLVRDPSMRARLAHAAYLKTLALFGPRQRALQFGRVLDQVEGGTKGARGFALDAHLSSRQYAAPKIFPSDVVFENDTGGWADVSVVIPLYNYEHHIVEALDSVAAQTLSQIDLVIVDGKSTDRSLEIAVKWARKNAARFNRIAVLKNQENYGLGLCRNSGFDAADTPYVMLLDADNRLLPACCEELLQSIITSGAAYIYPTVQHFGASTSTISNAPYDPQRFVAGNYVDAMALVSKEAWAMVGGFEHVRHGWEDYDFWCRLAEMGLVGEWRSAILAEYRVHATSMMKQQTTVAGNYLRLMSNFEQRHPWVSLVDRETSRGKTVPSAKSHAARQRLDDLLPILRCPVTGQKLMYSDDKCSLISMDGVQTWPIVAGRPALAPELSEPEIRPFDLISNEVPEAAMEIIRETKGWVLNLSGGGSATKFDHVVEVEYAVFRHTDILSDAHHLPFDDESFDAVISMNAFEHYREPHLVAAELLRVLKPGGKLHVRTAFLQPLHEKPWHFYNCTRYGMAEWFKAFDVTKLDVSDNFCPNHTMAWLASECESALRSDVSPQSAEMFGQARVRDIVELWRNPASRSSRLWTDFNELSQDNQEITAAGFELIAFKPDRKSQGSNILKT